MLHPQNFCSRVYAIVSIDVGDFFQGEVAVVIPQEVLTQEDGIITNFILFHHLSKVHTGFNCPQRKKKEG